MGSVRRVLKSLLVVLAGFVALGLAAAPAGAETATSFMEIKPRGPLFKDSYQPVDVRLEVKVTPEPGATTISELANTRLNLPKDFTFSTEGTPVCEKDIGQKDPENANRPTAEVIADCPDSVVGQGTAVIHVAGQLAARIDDPQLTVFNGGKNASGDPILLIHGFSASVLPGGYGVPMQGALKDGVLDVSVPPLAANSAVTEFTFDLPGKIGKDPNYSQAKCTTGTWRANAILQLHDFNTATGTYENLQTIETADTVQACTGGVGGPKFGSIKVKGPKSVKAGSSRTYKVKLKNVGKGTANNVKVAASGKGAKGKGAVGSLRAGKSKTVRVKVKFERKGTTTVKFRATGTGVKAKVKTFKVKVR